MKEEILALLKNEVSGIDFSGEALVDDGILDSLSLVEIITALSMEYGIEIPYEEVTPENFNSVDSMAALVERLKED